MYGITYQLIVYSHASTVEPLSNDHPHQQTSLLYDHISCDVVGAAQHI